MPDKKTKRPAVVVVMGHIDHGKSTLLDYIRKSNVAGGEAGGITQHISAYVVEHPNEKGEVEKITFLDTPGHAAFTRIRERGAAVADIAILVVSAEDSVKTQTLEALATIKESNTPFIVAINKIDRPAANPEKTKIDLNEAGVYLEGYGGDIPYAEISAKTGAGIPHLLELILLVAELADFKYDPKKQAEGIVVESRLDPKRGISASFIIKEGVLHKGDYILVGNAICGTRIMENYLGKQITEAEASTPVSLTGFDELPPVGSVFVSFSSKKEAETARDEQTKGPRNVDQQILGKPGAHAKIIPLILRADTSGSLDAIEKEIEKIVNEDITFKIAAKGIGNINEFDMKLASADPSALVVGFHVKVDSGAEDLKMKNNGFVETFDIIYKLTERLAGILETERPRKQIEEVTGTIKILKTFSRTKERQVVGGRITVGKCTDRSQIRVLRRDEEICRGHIVGLQVSKISAKEALEGTECGVLVESKIEIAAGDMLECITTTTK
ncbi:MAG: translation initiation factor translation initiation factor [Candidatus Parcubacteria bacterium]|jgi:translation initiation factor IF-2